MSFKKLSELFKKTSLRDFFYSVKKNKQEEFSFNFSTIENDDFLLKIKLFIISKPCNEKINVKEIANEFNLSERTILRRIKAKTGLTTINFINQCKMEHSIHLMNKEKDLSIAEITYCLGYNTPSYFSKCFKETYNKTPSEIKKYNNNL
ncbi:helix-turn-helix domain-containing protein [Tenacibaculum jejuense]|uniref:HTH araC/xylS-type domain-containing protein n=1 Tax=Tenacibaculum jejuense TaxID=584609 RepID=A0A238UCG9_9FLAO|nr:helix-turn-helix domain-containing protein [Tenacibaculum jejuense]SNR16792.1 protein of unknown function [Tenacibaculum jejuense]